MCGLFGQLGAQLKEHSQNLVLNALNERGPDGRGIHIEQVDVPSDLCLTFLHTRLAIQDLSSLGHQPMGSPEGNLWLIFNGEIYNQFQLRQELQQAGFCFRSTSDTEVLLHGYRYWGNRLWGKLNGIFAVAIWDRLNAELILARDSCGVKPLLWQYCSAALTFASELSAFEAAGLASRKQLSIEALQSFALWGAVEAPLTLLKGVKVFPAGHYVVCRAGNEGLKVLQPQPFTAPVSAPAPLADLLVQAVSRQAIGDRPVGLFLSGGLDSGLLGALLRQQQQGPINSLSVGFEELPGAVDESDQAAHTSGHLGLNHQRVVISAKDLEASFEPFLAAIDQPSIDGFNTFLVSQAARSIGMVVAFSGLGADELFYGYRHMAWRSAYKRLASRRISASGLNPWLKNELLRAQLQTSDQAANAQKEECGRYLQNTLLRDSDAVSMALGLELRVPFLDPDLIAFAKGRSSAEHLSAGPKTLLRAQAETLLPAEILRRPKLGFNLPLASWLSSDTRFAPTRLINQLAQIEIPAHAIWRSWFLMQTSPRRFAPYWRWVVLSEWLAMN